MSNVLAIWPREQRFFSLAETDYIVHMINEFALFFRDLIVIGIALSVLGVAAGALYIPTFQNCLDAVK